MAFIIELFNVLIAALQNKMNNLTSSRQVLNEQRVGLSWEGVPATEKNALSPPGWVLFPGDHQEAVITRPEGSGGGTVVEEVTEAAEGGGR